MRWPAPAAGEVQRPVWYNTYLAARTQRTLKGLRGEFKDGACARRLPARRFGACFIVRCSRPLWDTLLAGGSLRSQGPARPGACDDELLLEAGRVEFEEDALLPVRCHVIFTARRAWTIRIVSSLLFGCVLPGASFPPRGSSPSGNSSAESEDSFRRESPCSWQETANVIDPGCRFVPSDHSLSARDTLPPEAPHPAKSTPGKWFLYGARAVPQWSPRPPPTMSMCTVYGIWESGEWRRWL